MDRYIPEIKGELRSFMLKVPPVIYTATGIIINGKRIKSVLFSTDVSIICNCNADAVIAVYPFTPQPIITRAIMTAAISPVFCGVGGGRTRGERVLALAEEAEQQGAMGVVLNAPTIDETIEIVKKRIDIPIVITVVSENEDFENRIKAGATIFNVSAAGNTPKVVAKIRERLPHVAIMATGGPTDESIAETIAAGANSITWTPPSSGEIFKDIMTKYRKEK